MEELIGQLEEIAVAAGAATTEVYCSEIISSQKQDMSPVTIADARSEEIILRRLRSLYPHIPVVAEEECSGGHIPESLTGRFFLVDPLDGTKEFIQKRDEYTVNIALVENGIPVAGVVFAPALGVLYSGNGADAFRVTFDKAGNVTEREKVTVRDCNSAPVAVASRSHCDAATTEFLDRLGVHSFLSVGSSLKFCLVAEGRADVYPRLGRTMEWDTAAGHAVLLAAGGSVTCLDGSPFLYGKRNQLADTDFANPAFVARGRNVAVA